MIRNLIKRYKEGVHPCMLIFLIQYYYDNEVEAMYDGDHILTDLDSFPVTGRHLPLYSYGYPTLVNEFTELNDEEKQLLKQYIEQYE